MKTQNEIDAGNQFAAYSAGWLAGAVIRAMDPKSAHHENALIRDAYHQGYEAGQHARRQAAHFAAQKYRHEIAMVHLLNTPPEEPST